MSGQWLTSKQVEIYMNARKEGKTQGVSAAKAGISERRGRDIEKGQRIDPSAQQRAWRTRADPFEAVWVSQIEPMLQRSPALSPLTLLEHLQSIHGEESFPDKLLRTLQRRVKRWLHQEGPAREVMFRQEHDQFLGVPVPQLRKLAKSYDLLSMDEVVDLLQSPINVFDGKWGGACGKSIKRFYT